MEVVLSRRNLEALLSKLDTAGSACTIIKPDGTVVRAEENDDHYGPRLPGVMHPVTEQDLTVKHLRAALEHIAFIPCPTPCPNCPDCARDMAAMAQVAREALQGKATT